MYEVKLINNEEEIIINAVSTNKEAPRITGQCKFSINTIDSFKFTILPNNIGFNSIYNLRSLVEVKNTKTNVIEFKGRVLLSTPKMSSSGLFSKSVVCESELGYLMDSVQSYGEYHNISVRGFLELMINNHNSQVSEDKQFTVGVVDVIDNNDSLYRYLGYDKTFDTIKEKLIDRLGGELRVRYEDGIRYLDYVQAIGELKETEIVLSKNLITLEQERDPSEIITRLIPLGGKLEDSEARLTIESINNGLNYIDDVEAIEEFGIIADSVSFDNVTIVENLLSKGKAYLKENNRIKKKHKIDVLDLSIIGLDIDSFNIGNAHRVVNPVMGIDEELRIIEKTLDINSPQSSSFTVGDKFEDIKDYQLSVQKASIEARKQADEAKAKANYVETYTTDEVYRVDGRINDLTVEVSNKFEKVNDSINNIQNNIENNKEKLLKIHFIKTIGTVGDCILIECENGINILIDSNEEFVAGENINYIKSIGVSKLDYIIISHHHSDHNGAMAYILDEFDTTGAIAFQRTPDWNRMPTIETDWLTKEYHDKFISKCNEKGIKLITPKDRNRVNISNDTYFEFYNVDCNDYSDYNNLSLCVLLVHKNMKYFFAGDIGYSAQKVEHLNVREVDLYKCEHHCYNTKTSEEWINKLNPSIAITTRSYGDIKSNSSTAGILQLKRIPNYVQYDVGNTIVVTSTGYTFKLNTNKNFLHKNTWFNKNESGNWYYFKEDGSVAKNETLNINGTSYEFDNTGLCLNP